MILDANITPIAGMKVVHADTGEPVGPWAKVDDVAGTVLRPGHDAPEAVPIRLEFPDDVTRALAGYHDALIHRRAPADEVQGARAALDNAIRAQGRAAIAADASVAKAEPVKAEPIPKPGT